MICEGLVLIFFSILNDEKLASRLKIIPISRLEYKNYALFTTILMQMLKFLVG